MLEVVAKGFASARSALTGRTTLTEENIDQALRDIRVSLLEADVELGVVKRFLARVRTRAVGEVVTTRVKGGPKGRTPGDHFTYICHKELVALMGEVEAKPIAFRRPYTVLMLVGLQGVGKTTTCGKLAKTLAAQGRRPLLVAADTQRPAAQQQLKVLGERLDVPVWYAPGLTPAQLCEQAKTEAKAHKCDVIILDTAGRLSIDAPLMQELVDIRTQVQPQETLLVCDAMAGQDTVQTAQAFDQQLGLTGFIMTKLDGDARGGAALSIREICGKPIKYLGTGEGLDKLERFRPEGLASRILGMGDIVGLMEDFEQVVDEKQAERDTKKMLRGQFTLDDFLSQLRMIKKMGSLKDIMAKVPGMAGAGAQIDDRSLVGIEALIQSMTAKERHTPAIIDASRSARIARGAGRKPEELAGLLQRFAGMQQMMANFSKQPGLMAALPGMGQLGGGGLKKMLGKLGGGRGGMMPPGLGSMGLPGSGASQPAMGGLPGLGGMMGGAGPQGAGPGEGLTPEQAQAMQRMQSAMGAGPRAATPQRDRQRAKDKRKAERKARKKARR